MESLHIVLGLLFISQTQASLSLSDYPSGYAFDSELHGSVLDSEMCRKQLQHMLFNDTFLMFEFFDAGPRVPRGILTGNLKSLGNFHQCLAISRFVDDTMIIDGKYCTVNVAFNQNLNYISSPSLELPEEWIKEWEIYYQYLNEHAFLENYEARQSNLRDYLVFGPDIKGSTRNNDNRLDTASILTGIDFTIALCIPKVCTVDDVINNIVDVTSVIQFRPNQCRLPNDKPWVAADYVAIVIFSILGLIILISTCYDLHHIFYLKRSQKQTHPLRKFSAYSNIANLLDTSNRPGTLQCLDGVRALAMLWVVLGHTFYIIPFVGSNLLDLLEWQQAVKGIWITGALHTVDTFFMLSGLLLVYISIAKFKSGVGLLKNLHLFYLHRILRMLPILAIMVLFEASLYNRVSDGPLWDLAGNSVHKCRTFWWTTLLFLQNFVNPHETCLGVSWYLAIDVHLHIISPLVLYWLLRGSKRSAWAALVIGLLVSFTVATIYIFLVGVHEDYYADYYVNVFTRSPPFFVGMIVGYCLRIYRDKEFRMSAVLSAVITTVCAGLTFVMMYLNFLKGLSDWDNETLSNIIDIFSRSIWSASLGWIIFACVNGYGGPINYILSMGIWKIPSRLSYAIYLVHFTLMLAYYSSIIEPVYFSISSGLFRFCGFFSITLVLSILITALIDSPFAEILKINFKLGGEKKPAAKTQESEHQKEIEEAQVVKNGTSEGFVADEEEKIKIIKSQL